MIRNLICISTLFVLSGCASMNDKFACPMEPSGGCMSVSEVNKKVANGEIIDAPAKTDKQESTLIREVKLSGEVLPLFKNPPPPIRVTEKVIKVWIAPFEDMSGDYHGAASIFTVVKDGHWIERPLKEMKQG